MLTVLLCDIMVTKVFARMGLLVGFLIAAIGSEASLTGHPAWLIEVGFVVGCSVLLLCTLSSLSFHSLFVSSSLPSKTCQQVPL